jgi:hypothetical protein
MNNLEYEEDITLEKLKNDFNIIKNNPNLKVDYNNFIKDISVCHNDESALSLNKLKIEDNLISIDFGGFKYCYPLSELNDLIMGALNKYRRDNPTEEATVSKIVVRDLYTNMEIPNSILQEVYDYVNKKDDRLVEIFKEALYIVEEDPQEFIIELIKYDRSLIVNAKYYFTKEYFYPTPMTPLQQICKRNLADVAMYILNNFSPSECLLNDISVEEKSALIYAIEHIYKRNPEDKMRIVTMIILDFEPYENNLFYVNDLRNNHTSFMHACYYGLTDVALKILEKEPSIDFINIRADIVSENQQALYDEYSMEGKTAVDMAVNNEMIEVLDKLVELYGQSMKREKRQRSNMYGNIDDLNMYDNRLFEFEPRGHQGGLTIRYKRKSKKKSKKKSNKKSKRKSRKNSKKR